MEANDRNIIKIREDNVQLILESPKTQTDVLSVNTEVGFPSWFPVEEGEIDLKRLRTYIEPWLTALFQSEHLSLLAGSGLTLSVEYLSSGQVSSLMSNLMFSTRLQEQIRNRSREFAEIGGRKEPNIEDLIRVLNDLIRGLKILENCSEEGKALAMCNEIEDSLKINLDNFIKSVVQSEKNVITGDNTDTAISYLVSFLMSFASRTGTRDRLNIFTTNYDRLIEMGADLAGLHLIDRFVGKLSPIFRSSRLDIDMHYNPPGIRGEPRYLEGVARFTKVHGSLDWVDTGNSIRRVGLPFGADNFEDYLKTSGLESLDSNRVMIYPNASKDRETSEYPYVELFRDLAAALCRPNSTLVTYGYGFGDDHINRVIKDMLTIPSTHLVVISYDDPGGRIMNKVQEFGRLSQTSLIIGKDVANLKTLVDYFLPKPSIDRASLRMSDLLRQRFTNQANEQQNIIHDKEDGIP